MNRRTFLCNSLLSAGSFLLAPRLAVAQVSVKPERVLIIGAGLSGLVTAYELQKKRL